MTSKDLAINCVVAVVGFLKKLNMMREDFSLRIRNEECEAEKLSHFRPDVLTDSNYWHDEPIDEDE
jgi:hypothetical protein